MPSKVIGVVNGIYWKYSDAISRTATPFDCGRAVAAARCISAFLVLPSAHPQPVGAPVQQPPSMACHSALGVALLLAPIGDEIILSMALSICRAESASWRLEENRLGQG